jgi:pimeloyl-[acyl-carrier protein] methyl ester esterase
VNIGLVLLPGMDGTGELFGPLLARLPLDLRVSVVSYPDRPQTYAEHESWARHELPRSDPFVLLGESFSGPIAVKVASSGPPNLRGIILCASFLTCPSRALRLMRSLTPLASPKLVPGFVAQRSLLGTFATPELRAAQTRALEHVSSRTLTARLRAMADVDVRAEAKAISVPTLYLQASADRLVGTRSADEYVAHARQPRLERMEGPHLLLQANPDRCARAIARVISDCR